MRTSKARKAVPDVIPFPGRLVPRLGHDEPPRASPSRTYDPVIADTQAALDRMDRQLRNLRELLGERFDQDDGPRAA